MKKISSVILASALAVGAMTGCKKSFLDETVYSAYAPSTLSDSLGMEASLTGLYNHFSQFYTTSDRQGFLSVWQAGTDIAWAAQPEGIEVPYYNYSQLVSTDAAASFTWSWAYRMINNTNIIIQNAENPELTSMQQSSKDEISGEARFFRAYAYNVLATCFGRVPVVTAPLSAPKTDFTRAPLAEVNKVIEDDLLFAAQKLKDIDAVKSNAKGRMYGRANKYMAMQLLSEAYLRMNKPAEAEQQAQAVINSGKFSLTRTRYGIKAGQPGDAFSDMFIYGNQRRSQGNREAIWVMEMENPNTVVGGITNSPQQRRVWVGAYYNITGMKIVDSLGGRGVARLRLNNYVLYGLYGSQDMRNSSYNLRRQLFYNDPARPATFGQPVPYSGFDTVFRTTPYSTKWGQFDPADEFGFAMIKDIIHMRLGETYLLLAEAQFKQGKLAEAAESINVLRRRANANEINANVVTLDFVLDERIRELVGEENRRMTLMRTGTLVSRVLRANPANPNYPASLSVSGIQNHHQLLPIPQTEINLNKDALLEQNPGY